MGLTICKSKSSLPASAESPTLARRVAAKEHRGRGLTSYREVNEFVSDGRRGDELRAITSLVASGPELLDVLKQLHVQAGFYRPRLHPVGDWAFVPHEKESVLPVLLQSLRALPLGECLSHLRTWVLHGGSAGPSSPLAAASDLATSRLLTDNALFLLSLCEPSLRVALRAPDAAPALLFSLMRDGESWTRFMDQVDGYRAPVLLVVKTKERPDALVGAFVQEGLRETGSKFGGSSDLFLFGLSVKSATSSEAGASPFLVVRRPTGYEQHFYLFNRSSQYATKGLCFGGDDRAPRFQLDADLQTLTLLIACRSFEAGPLVPAAEPEEYATTYSIEDLELWGFGSAAATEQQASRRAGMEEMKCERRKVDLAKMLAGDPTGLMKKNVNAGERQGEAEVIIEARNRERGRD